MKKPANPTTPRQQKPDPHTDTSDGESAVLATIAAMPEPDRVIDRAAPCDHQSQCASPLAETLVRDARVCKGRQGSLLLPGQGEI